MERKSAWTLPMSEQEIVTSYMTAAKPQKQIRILAELNGCDKKTIANILTAADCELPGNMKPKKKVQPLEETEAAPDFAKVQPAPKEDPLPISVQIQLAALRAINNMVPEDFGDERVAGLLEFVREVEHGKI